MGSGVVNARGLSGGSINDAYCVDLKDRRRVFVKTHAHPVPGMYVAEAAGLAWLAEAKALAVPAVLATSEDFLVLEYLDSGARIAEFDAVLGRGLAALHRFGAPSFGFVESNFIGNLPQHNASTQRWSEFYAQHRLLAQAEAAAARGIVDSRFLQTIESVCNALPALVDDGEAPARLHGDLWGGNLHVTSSGHPCLIDPAVYGGHREVDLAMMRLFGGFSERVFAAYDEAFPLASGWRHRVPLYQLYPLLVHVNLFGAGYVGQARAAALSYL